MSHWCEFLGAFGYADDVLLLAPSRQALQEMLCICEDFSTKHSMLFSTDPNPVKSKTKCLLFSRDITPDQVLQVQLNGDNLPWVDTAKHLGNHLSSKLNLSSYIPETSTDLLKKRAILFDRVHQIQQQFGYLNPRMVVKLLSIYSTSLYGSCLWEVDSGQFEKLIRSWNMAVKQTGGSHTQLVPDLLNNSPAPHLESVLILASLKT